VRGPLNIARPIQAWPVMDVVTRFQPARPSEMWSSEAKRRAIV